MVETREVLNESPGDFNAVRPGEVCTVETAKALGVFDAARYFAAEAGLGDTRTFGDRTPGDASRQYALCAEDADGASARPFCPLVGPGLAPTADGEACAFPECPPGFQHAGNGACTKPVVAASVPRASRCDAQWHDWFTVPNAHMGNGYAKVDGACRAPCPGSSVPASGTDPLSGKNRGGSADGQCVDKMEYLGAKFADDSDICALAWVKRMSSDGSQMARETRASQPLFLSGASAVRASADAAAHDALLEAHSRLENVAPDTASMQVLCRTLETPERLADAYATCKAVRDDRAGEAYRDYASRLRTTFPGMAELDVQRRWRVLNQACHHAFCDTHSGGDRAFRAGKPPLCFAADKIARMDMGDGADALPAGARPSSYEAEPPPEMEENLGGLDEGYAKTMDKLLAFFLVFITFVMSLVAAYYLSQVIWPDWDIEARSFLSDLKKLMAGL